MDTGLFLDHRETRKWISGFCENKIVLNTFAYTGSFSVYCSRAGASKTVSVDLSKTYTEWIRENLNLNGCNEEKNWVYKMDTLEFFRYAKRKEMKFDIIIIDPPTFSKNKGKSFSVQKDHGALLEGAISILNEGGFIMFSNNCLTFRMSEEILRKYNVEDITGNFLPVDFREKDRRPIHNAFIIKANKL